MSRRAEGERQGPDATEGSVNQARTEVTIARLRAEVASLHAELVRYGLVVWTGGDISARVPGVDLFVIKPSGLGYEQLAPENMILCDLDGAVVDSTPGSERAPAHDVGVHAYIYRQLSEIGAIAHTHSPYAVAWAARGEQIPCVLATMAAEFGGPVPVGAPATVGDDGIGRAVVDMLRTGPSPAVLLRGHGPYTVGASARDAVRAAVVLEDAARAVQLARDGGAVQPLPADEIDRLHARHLQALTETTDDDRVLAAGRQADRMETTPVRSSDN